MPLVTLADIQAAATRIAPVIYRSPCRHSAILSELTGFQVVCKLDLFQRTGSFKERGAANALRLLADFHHKNDTTTNGVIAASAGNHALALAYHASLLSIPATVVMPTTAPLIKISNCRRLGANVIVHGNSFADARQHADQLAAQNDLTYLHGFDDPAVIAGQGTVALELLDDEPDLDAIVVPVGGGGLIAGIATAVKSINSHIQIIGVEPQNANCAAAALEHGEPITTPPQPTLADGLAVPRVGDNCFPLIQQYVDRMITVDEPAIASAVLSLVEHTKFVAEGAAATTLAALNTGRLDDLKNKRVALLLCGGNIDPNLLTRVIELGLVADHRLARFTVTISDRPGGLMQFTSAVAKVGGNVQQITHERAFAGADVSRTRITCTVETRGADHLEQLCAHLRASGFLDITTH